jgi:shikimate 5-dehydrogenase
MEWLHFGFEAKWFAAVLGHPVFHSRTPAEQSHFFRKCSAPVLRIDVTSEDIDEGVLDVLHEIGLRAAAVTSPLKKRVYAACKDFTRRAYELESVNTIVWDGNINGWRGHNTDYDGIKALLSHIRQNDRVAVWGAGGTKEVIQARIPQARFHSVRQGGDPSDDPTVLIWAVSRQRAVNPPPEAFRPRIVLDLNYAEDSPGRSFAKDRGCEYVSGLAMFKAQARAQRAFWENYVR